MKETTVTTSNCIFIEETVWYRRMWSSLIRRIGFGEKICIGGKTYRVRSVIDSTTVTVIEKR